MIQTGATRHYPQSYFFLAVWLSGALLVAVFSSYFRAKRRRDAEQAAQRMGFLPVPAERWDFFSELQHPLFTQARDPEVDWAAEGEADGLPARLMDLRYTVGRGRSTDTVRQTVATFRLPVAELPTFQLHPHQWFDFLGGLREIRFEGAEAFSASYRLHGPDEEAVRRLFTPGMRDALAGEPGWSVEGQGRTLVLYHARQLAAPDRLPEFLAQARQAAAAFLR